MKYYIGKKIDLNCILLREYDKDYLIYFPHTPMWFFTSRGYLIPRNHEIVSELKKTKIIRDGDVLLTSALVTLIMFALTLGAFLTGGFLTGDHDGSDIAKLALCLIFLIKFSINVWKNFFGLFTLQRTLSKLFLQSDILLTREQYTAELLVSYSWLQRRFRLFEFSCLIIALIFWPGLLELTPIFYPDFTYTECGKPVYVYLTNDFLPICALVTDSAMDSNETLRVKLEELKQQDNIDVECALNRIVGNKPAEISLIQEMRDTCDIIILLVVVLIVTVISTVGFTVFYISTEKRYRLYKNSVSLGEAFWKK